MVSYFDHQVNLGVSIDQNESQVDENFTYLIITFLCIKLILISNSNWTEWSTIQGVIGRVISNQPSAKREADLKLRAQLLPELYDTKSNY